MTGGFVVVKDKAGQNVFEAFAILLKISVQLKAKGAMSSSCI